VTLYNTPVFTRWPAVEPCFRHRSRRAGTSVRVVGGGTAFNGMDNTALHSRPGSGGAPSGRELQRIAAGASREVTAAAGADVLISNTPSSDGSKTKIPALGPAQARRAHPYCHRPRQAMQRYLTVRASASRAGLAKTRSNGMPYFAALVVFGRDCHCIASPPMSNSALRVRVAGAHDSTMAWVCAAAKALGARDGFRLISVPPRGQSLPIRSAGLPRDSLDSFSRSGRHFPQKRGGAAEKASRSAMAGVGWSRIAT